MRFEKVSLEQYKKDFESDFVYARQQEYFMKDRFSLYGFDTIKEKSVEEIYEEIQLPKRSTKKSAGYDFKAPYSFVLEPGETVKISTGIRVILDDDKFLMCAPRSGHGFKARIQLDNTIGIIDADYSDSSNEGHIMMKLTNDGKHGKSIEVHQGDSMLQAIIVQYFKVDDDDADGVRDGGLGSTDKK